MQRPPDSHPRATSRTRATLVLAVVASAHWAVLGAATGPAPRGGGAMVFETRLLPTDPVAQPMATESAHSIPKTVRPRAVAKLTTRQPQPPAATVDDAQAAAVPTVEPAIAVQVATAQTEDLPTTAKPATAAQPASVRAPQLPETVRLLYDIKGEIKRIPISANGELNWRQDGKTYDARLEISIFLLGSRVQTSKGLIGPQGLEPVRFGDKVRSEVAAHFERGKGKVTYSANTPDEVLQAGAQDQLSIFFQLAGLLAANPERYAAGSSLSFQAVGPRSSETWVFKVAAPDVVALPGGRVRAIRLSKDPVSEYDSRAEVWLAPELDYLPVRIRLTQGNGDVVDQLWRATERPKPTP